MTTRKTEGKVESIFTRHTPHRNFIKGDRKYARITIWAKTEPGHQVWLETARDSGGIEKRCRKHEERYQHLIGKNISYNLKTNRYTGYERGFIRQK